MFELHKLTVDYRENPLGVENRTPRFGWQISSTERCFEQAAYRICVAESQEKLDAPDCWDSGIIEGACSNNIVYAGTALEGAKIYWFRVWAKSAAGEWMSADSMFETALFHENFSAKWIGQPGYRNGWAPYLRKGFHIGKQLQRARLYVCGLGYGETWLNGQAVTEDVLEPVNTNYEKLVFYAAYDVTDKLYTGENAIGVLLGCGFYSQDRVWDNGNLFYGKPSLLAELHLWYEDGSKEVVLSDESWQCDYSPVTLNNVYGGETYDARMEQPRWCEPGFCAAGWQSAAEMPAPGGELVCRQIPPIRRCRKVKPVSIRHHHPGFADQTWIVDMGENFTGWARINIPYSPAGAEYVLRFAEDADDKGMDYTSCGLYHTCLLQQDRYIARGAAEGEFFEPRFTYHGFRYIEITGVNLMSLELPEEFLEVYAVNTNLETTGAFLTDFQPANDFQTIGLRTYLSNYHGVPEDCPVREKCGWLGDGQLVSEVAMNNFDTALCYEKYLEDIRTTKEIYGDWQMVAPGKRSCGNAAPLWGCAQVTIPWNLYLYYNDRTVLEKYYPLMKEWVEHELNRSNDYVINVGLGDWCPPGGNENEERIPVEFSSTAEFYHVTDLTAKAAAVLGKEAEAEELEDLKERIKAALNRRFLNANIPTYGTMGADGVALAYGFCPEVLREAVAADCMWILKERCEGAFYTGIYGNKNMVPAMTEAGYGSEMLAALFNPDKTSFATMMTSGATSIWECFDDGFDCQSYYNGVTSRNHPMHFAFASWYYTHILGIRPTEEAPGYHRFLVKPYPMDQLHSVEGYRETPYGRVDLAWQDKESIFEMKLTVPANTRAVCELPLHTVKSDTADTDCTLQVMEKGCKLEIESQVQADRICFELGSGEYVLTVGE